MQDSAEGFGQPIRRVFAPFFQTHVELPSPDDAAPRYRVQVTDRFMTSVYRPMGNAVPRLAQWVGRLQHGRISIYLLYTFLTLLAMLMVVLQ